MRTVPDRPAAEQAVLASRVALAPGGRQPAWCRRGPSGGHRGGCAHGRQHNPAAQDSPLAFLVHTTRHAQRRRWAPPMTPCVSAFASRRENIALPGEGRNSLAGNTRRRSSDAGCACINERWRNVQGARAAMGGRVGAGPARPRSVTGRCPAHAGRGLPSL